ncbi:MAG TPA: S8 family serine peptidase [Blastocatellia bacterium]|nr:S8 family serine peptidase [Blastocatellia bacterium]
MRKAHSPTLVLLVSALLIVHLATNAFAGISFIAGEGVVLTGAEGVVLTGAEGVVLTGAEGVVLTGAEGVVLTGAEGVVLTGAEALTYTGAEGVVLTGAEAAGLRSFDPELAWLLNALPDSSAVNVFVIFHQMPTADDFNALRSAGVVGGTIYHNLPIALINATRSQIAAISRLSSVRTIYSNKTIEFLTHDTRIITGQTSVVSDPVLTQRNGNAPLSGRGVTVAVLDTGIDATHPDLTYGTHVVQNVKVADLQGSSPAFLYPQVIEGLPATDLTLGHGTFVAGVIAGTGAASDGYYGGMAPGTNLLGVSCGDASLFFVLSGIDYILSHKDALNIRVVNCSFGISGLFDANDPVNVATSIMHDAGISVVFSAGNRGSEPNSLNPYSVADWVIGVGSGTKSGSLSSFSSRGAAGYGMFHPTLIAPGESVVSSRASGINVVGTSGLSAGLASPDNDLRTIPLPYIPRYTCSSGTSFAAPHVAGTIALMLQATPDLTVDQIKQILQQTATPMLGYSSYEVGAGYLNTYAAVRKAGLGKPYGAFRTSINNTRVTYSRDPISQFIGSVAPGSTYSRTFNIPPDALFATVEIGWIPNGSLLNNLRATLTGPGGTISLPDPGLLAMPAFKKTGFTINDPPSGNWTISIANNGFLFGSAQQLVMAVETFRASYSVSGLSQLSPSDRALVKRALRTGLLTTSSADFSGGSPATRLDVARVAMLGAGARVPQYLADVPSFSDEPNDANAIFIESVTNSPFGDLLGSAGTNFYPQASVSRANVAVAIVKALGLDTDAQAASSINPGLVDWNQIPIAARGYVSLAISRNLMRAASGMFRPNESITRFELAVSGVALQQAAR